MMLPIPTQSNNYVFNGPHLNESSLPTKSGVYVITKKLLNGSYEIIDVGESHNISERIPSHDRMNQWSLVSNNAFNVWTFLADQSQRMIVERDIRITYNPICGQR